MTLTVVITISVQDQLSVTTAPPQDSGQSVDSVVCRRDRLIDYIVNLLIGTDLNSYESLSVEELLTRVKVFVLQLETVYKLLTDENNNFFDDMAGSSSDLDFLARVRYIAIRAVRRLTEI